MYAEIPGSESSKFKEIIKEHGVYTLKKFLISPAKQSYKPFPAEYMIRFTPWTVVHPLANIPMDFPKHKYNLTSLTDLSSFVGSQECFVDILGQIVGVSKVMGLEIKLVLWGQRAEEFEADLVHETGQESSVVGIFVGLLMKSYNNEETLSGGSACRWYLNEDLPEIESFFENLGDEFVKTKWISTGAENFRSNRSRSDLPVKTVAELCDMDPWETEGTDLLCTVTIARLTPDQPWWFWSCSKCHRSATAYGSEFRCSGGCVSTRAYPKFRLCLVATDGTGSAEFVFFNRVA